MKELGLIGADLLVLLKLFNTIHPLDHIHRFNLILRYMKLELLINFAKMNGMMDWPFSAVLNEYLTVQYHHGEGDTIK